MDTDYESGVRSSFEFGATNFCVLLNFSFVLAKLQKKTCTCNDITWKTFRKALKNKMYCGYLDVMMSFLWEEWTWTKLRNTYNYTVIHVHKLCIFSGQKKSWKWCSTGTLQTGDLLVAATCAVLWCSMPQVHSCPCLLGLQCRSRLHKATITEGLFMCGITQLPNQILSGSPESEP